MKARIAIVSFVVVLLSFLAGNSYAVMHRVWFNAWTQKEIDPTGAAVKKLIVYVEVFDDEKSHPPDFVSAVKITAPDGSIFYLDLSKDWLPWDKAFWKAFSATDFVGGVIPSGKYYAKVVPDVGSVIVELDDVTASYLAVPVVTYPKLGATGVPQTPTFTWNAVTGATYYRIMLVNDSWQEPVYYSSFRTKYTDFTTYTIPPGDLKPNCNYRMRIEARSGSQDMDMRSRSTWINFTTGNW